MTSRIGRSAAVWLALIGAGCNASFPASPSAFNAPATRVGLEIFAFPHPSPVPTGSLLSFGAYTADTASVYQPVAATMTSSNPSVLAREGASWRAVSPGSVEVTATFEGAVSSIFVTVGSPQFPYLEIRGLASAIAGRTSGVPLSAWIHNGPNDSPVVAAATWTSSNPQVATISSLGAVTGVSIGMTEITASSGALSVSYRWSTLPRRLRPF